MKQLIGLGFILLAFPLSVLADTIVFNDGMRVDATRVWEQDGKVQCEIDGIVFGYPKADVRRIEKNGSGCRAPDRSVRPPDLRQHPLGKISSWSSFKSRFDHS